MRRCTQRELDAAYSHKLRREVGYQLTHWTGFDYNVLKYVRSIGRRGRNPTHYNNVIIGADSETSKKIDSEHNHVCVWTISLRAYGFNIGTLWGRNPRNMIRSISELQRNLNPRSKTIIFFHNLSYDWVFLRKFMFEVFGYPIKQLNTKSHYPILIEFSNGIILRDSLILAQRSLGKWARDLNVEHQKLVGDWDYNKLRHQSDKYDDWDLRYPENDTLSLVECIDTLINQLGTTLASLPFTATGIPRNEVRKLSEKNNGHSRFLSVVGDYEVQQKLEECFHGGYTHGNRHEMNFTLTGDEYPDVTDNIIRCYDEGSAYPYAMLTMRAPAERFFRVDNMSVDELLSESEYSFMTKLTMINPRLKNPTFPMPALQFSKALNVINPVLDNGRILKAAYVEIRLTELDIQVINEQYTWDSAVCADVYAARNDYLPKWFTNFVYECWKNKTLLKGGDPVAYALAKGRVNSLCGMCVQKPVKDDIVEDYSLNEFYLKEQDPLEKYKKYVQARKTCLPYTWGVWCTAAAFRAIFRIGSCAKHWIYSDTDSVYGIGWDIIKLNAYNEECVRRLTERGYPPIEHKGRTYALGVCELDGEYKEFRMLGSKRYACRGIDGKLKITVAGVPKIRGVNCLNDDINNFVRGLIFDGRTTGKLQHTYHYVDGIYVDSFGNVTGDSIDLTPCDYKLDGIVVNNIDELTYEEVEIDVADDGLIR